jgi:uncharacterized protein YydD (DUF2326 family)
MKLLKLHSDNPNFKTIVFKPGLNIVAGLQSSLSSTDSYNGIGKSSSLNLIHLMFGGSFDEKISSEKKLKAFLSTYGDFYLKFSVGTVVYEIRKNFSQTDFFLNEEKINKTNFPKKLNEILSLKNKINFNFKALFNMSARRYLPEKSYYSGALTQQGRPTTDYHQMLYNLVMLGVDTTLVKKNKIIADELSKLRKTEQLLNKQKLSINEEDYLDLKDELSRLLDAKENFIIAKNYDDLKRSADELTLSMACFRNEIHSNERDINKKNRILQTSIDEVFDISKVTSIYNEAKFHFQEQVTIRLEQAESFHLNIQKARKNRLKEEVLELIEKNNILNQKLHIIEAKRDKLLKDLDSSGALEEYNSIVERIRTIDKDISELTSYQTVLTQFEKDKAKLELDKAVIKDKSITFLAENKGHLDHVESMFRNLVKRFYRGQGGSFKVTNSKNAQYLYDIEPHIPKDGSQGINEVKIFCYDILLMTLNPNLIGFIAHDSCIFSGVDPRQVATMFKVVLEMVKQHDLQYFVNINKNTYDALLNDDASKETHEMLAGVDTSDFEHNIHSMFQPILTETDKAAIKLSTVLELFDAKPENTLYGKTFG